MKMTGSIIDPAGTQIKLIFFKLLFVLITGSIIGPAMAGPTGPFATALYSHFYVGSMHDYLLYLGSFITSGFRLYGQILCSSRCKDMLRPAGVAAL